MCPLGLLVFEQSLLLGWLQPCSCAKLPISLWEVEGRRGRGEPWLELGQEVRTRGLRLDSSSRLECFRVLKPLELGIFLSRAGLVSFTFLFPWLIVWVERLPSSLLKRFWLTNWFSLRFSPCLACMWISPNWCDVRVALEASEVSTALREGLALN